MRTLTQMVERLKIHVRGGENLTWKPSDYESALEEAARRMWRNLVETPAARCLRAFADGVTDAESLFELPVDCLRVEEVKFRNRQNVYVPLAFVLDDGPSFPEGYPRPLGICPPGWTNDVAERKIRLMRIPVGASLRVSYFREPVFPFVDDGTLRSPDGAETDTYPGIPEMADSACEHLAAALLLGEETSDPTPMQYHGAQYNSMLSMMSKACAVRPSRSYVKRVFGRNI